MKVSRGIEFVSGHGGKVTLNQERDNLEICGISEGYVYFEDVRINTHNNMLIDMSSGNTRATLTDENEEVVIEFGFTSTVPEGLADFEFDGLNDDEWYRLYFGDELANTKSGTAHGKTGANGKMKFNNVIVSNE